jgi:hypothetical protein
MYGNGSIEDKIVPRERIRSYVPSAAHQHLADFAMKVQKTSGQG